MDRQWPRLAPESSGIDTLHEDHCDPQVFGTRKFSYKPYIDQDMDELFGGRSCWTSRNATTDDAAFTSRCRGSGREVGGVVGGVPVDAEVSVSGLAKVLCGSPQAVVVERRSRSAGELVIVGVSLVPASRSVRLVALAATTDVALVRLELFAAARRGFALIFRNLPFSRHHRKRPRRLARLLCQVTRSVKRERSGKGGQKMTHRGGAEDAE